MLFNLSVLFSLAVLLFGFSQNASAAPITSLSTNELVRRDTSNAPSAHIYARNTHQVHIRVDNKGQHNEHWIVQVHKKDSADRPQSFHAQRPTDAWKKGDAMEMGHSSRFKTETSKGSSTHHHVADMTEAQAHQAAAHLKEFVKKNNNMAPAGENCVDFAHHAINHLHSNGLITGASKDAFHKHYNAQKATVKTNTGT